MISKLEEKHLEFIESEKKLVDETSNLIKKISNDKHNAFWHVKENENFALTEAEKLDALKKDEKISKKLFGLSVGVKDLFMVKDTITTAGSKVLDGFKAPYTSDLWEKLSNSGSLFASKVSMDEFAMGSYTNTSYLGKTSLYNNLEKTAGGSSGGSATSVKSGLVDFSIGSDTGGSIRQPASFSGLVGYKPSYGAFSRFGMIPYASSLDQASFMVNDLLDVKYILNSISLEKDKRDMTHKGLELNFEENKKIKIGYLPILLDNVDGFDEATINVYKKSIEDLKDKAELIPINIEYLQHAAKIYYIIATSEASSNLSVYQGVFFGNKIVNENFYGDYQEQVSQYRSKYFGKEVKKRIILGSFILSSDNFDDMYLKAISLRDELSEQINKVLSTVDMIILPTSPIVAPKWNDIDKMTSSQIYMADYLTVPFSLSGLPAISYPMNKSNESDLNGTNVGIQFVGKKFKDYQLINDMEKVLM